MKYLVVLMVIISLSACRTVEITAYEYRSSTMLGTRTVSITKDSVVTMFSGRAATKRMSRETTDAEWNELNDGAKTIKLDNIASLESPTNGRQTDAAPYGTVSISTKDSTYKSASFDGFNAHESLAPLMGTIEKIANSEFNK